MFDGAAPNQLAYQLPADAYYHLVHTLRLTLPPPLTDHPEDLIRRDHAAIARIAALAPANAAEAELAGQFVAASEQWKDCLRLAQSPETTPEWAAKCRAQANSMMRQANSALRLLLRVQEARRKLEQDTAACDRAAWTEHCALGLMAEALPARPPATSEPEPAAAKAGANPAASGSGPCQPVAGERPRSGEAAAEQCGGSQRLVADRVSGEKCSRGVPAPPPDDGSFPRRFPGPPDDDLAAARLAARIPALAARDRGPAEARAA